MRNIFIKMLDMASGNEDILLHCIVKEIFSIIAVTLYPNINYKHTDMYF